MRRVLGLLILLLGLAATAPAWAQTHAATAPPPLPAQPAQPAQPTGALAPADAARLIDVLRDDAKRAQFLSLLEAMAKALPPATATAAPADAAVAPAPADAAPAAAAPAIASPLGAAVAAVTHAPRAATDKLAIPLAPDSLGAQVLVGASNRLTILTAQLDDAARAVTDFPLIARWLAHLATDEDTRSDLLDAAWKLAVVLAAGLVAEHLLQRIVRRPAEALAGRAPAGPGPTLPPEVEGIAEAEAGQTERPKLRMTALLLLRRLPFTFGRFVLDLLPVLAVAAVGYALVGSTPLGAPSTTRLVILAVLNAYILCRAVVTVIHALVAPESPRLRLLPVSDSGADYILVWSRRIAVIGIFGYAIAEVALLFGLYRVAHDTLIKLVVLAIHVALIIVVLQKRRFVAGVIRGREDATGAIAVGRRLLASRWHIIAIFYLVALWLVWAFEVQDGFARLLRIFFSTLIVGVSARFLIKGTHTALARWMHIEPRLRERYPGLEQRVTRYHPVVRGLSSTVILAAAGIVLFQLWGVDSLAWFEPGALGGRVVSGLINIVLTLLIALLTWELANADVQRRLATVTREGRAGQSARLLTLLPMLRTVLLVTIILIAGLIVLSEIGVNIAPLLAGAGVIGLAIGFGSQKLVQDIITGLFLLLENAMQVGDVVTLGGMSGTVENLSVRAIKLRALDGSVHIIPFSAVTTVTNSSRDYGYAVLDIGVGLSEEPDHIGAVVQEVARKLRAEPRWASAIRDDIEVLGIERFVDLAYILRVRMMTLPGQRWAVARELNERIKERFDELAIDSPITSTKVLGVNPLLVRTHRSPDTGQVAG